jgi:hypothetical protein
MAKRKCPKLECPTCEAPAIAADHFKPGLGWRWTEGLDGFCPGCKARLVVRVTDDYEEDRVASLENLSPPRKGLESAAAAIEAMPKRDPLAEAKAVADEIMARPVPAPGSPEGRAIIEGLCEDRCRICKQLRSECCC